MDFKKVKPLGNRILVRRSEVTTTKNGIILPESAQEKPRQGEVIAVGPGLPNKKGELISLAVNVGDQVLFSSYSGTELPSGKEDEYLILSEEDILAVLQ